MLLNLSHKSGKMQAIVAVRELIAIALLFLFSINNEGLETARTSPRSIEGPHSALAPKFDLNSMRFAGPPMSATG